MSSVTCVPSSASTSVAVPRGCVCLSHMCTLLNPQRLCMSSVVCVPSSASAPVAVSIYGCACPQSCVYPHQHRPLLQSPEAVHVLSHMCTLLSLNPCCSPQRLCTSSVICVPSSQPPTRDHAIQVPGIYMSCT